MISNKLHFRLLALFVTVFGVSEIGWLAYSLAPRRTQTQPKYLVLPRLSAPIFQFSFRGLPEDEADEGWREVEIPGDTGRKILRLVRGSKSLWVELQEYVREHPEADYEARHFYPQDLELGSFAVYDDDAEQPTLQIRFLQAKIIGVTQQGKRDEIYVIRPGNQAELNDLLAEIKWGPMLTNEP